MDDPPFKLGEPRYNQVPEMIFEAPLLYIVLFSHFIFEYSVVPPNIPEYSSKQNIITVLIQ